MKCSDERSQVQNKEIAFQRLKAQLYVIAIEQKVKKIQEIKGDMVVGTSSVHILGQS